MTDIDQSLVASLARAQAKFGQIVKTHDNAAFKGATYADIADVLAVVRPALASEGIAVLQPIRITDDGCVLVTELRKGAEVIESVLPIDIAVTDQQLGSRLTYRRRYQLCALVGVHPEGDDDDGNAASSAEPEGRWQGGTRFPSTNPASDSQRRLVSDLLSQVVHVNMVAQYIEDVLGHPSPVEQLTKAEASPLIEKLKADKKAGVTPSDAIPTDGTEPFL